MCESDNDNNNDDDDDERPLVKDLLIEHAKSIEQVRERIIRSDSNSNNNKIGGGGKPLWDSWNGYDDIWILRFVLSHKGNVKHASEAALKTMAFREKWNLNRPERSDFGRRIQNYPGNSGGDTTATTTLPSLPGYERFCAHCTRPGALIVSQPDPDRDVLVYIDMGAIDCEGLTTLRKHDYTEWYVCILEAQYQVLDETTRRTGKLTKRTTFFDIGNLSFHPKFLKQEASTLRELEDFFPQMLRKQYLFRVPGWLSAIWMVVTKLFPKRFIEKIDVCPSGAASEFYEPIAKQVAKEHHPVQWGGTNTNWPPPSLAELRKNHHKT